MAVGSTRSAVPKQVLGVTEHGSAVAAGVKEITRLLSGDTKSAANAASPTGASQFADGRQVASKLIANAGRSIGASASRFGSFKVEKEHGKRGPSAIHEAVVARLASMPPEVAADVLNAMLRGMTIVAKANGQLTTAAA